MYIDTPEAREKRVFLRKLISRLMIMLSNETNESNIITLRRTINVLEDELTRLDPHTSVKYDTSTKAWTTND